MSTDRRKENQQKLENRNGKKNNCMNTSIDKLARLHTSKSRYSKKMKILKEKLNFCE